MTPYIHSFHRKPYLPGLPKSLDTKDSQKRDNMGIYDQSALHVNPSLKQAYWDSVALLKPNINDFTSNPYLRAEPHPRHNPVKHHHHRQTQHPLSTYEQQLHHLLILASFRTGTGSANGRAVHKGNARTILNCRSASIVVEDRQV